jgi:hypothetical protein
MWVVGRSAPDGCPDVPELRHRSVRPHGGPPHAQISTGTRIVAGSSYPCPSPEVASLLVSTVLHVVALVVAVVSVPSVAGLTAWSLTGGDGSAQSPLVAFLGLVVGIGSIYNVVICWRSFWFIAEWQWWLMWAPGVAGLLGVLLSSAESEESWRVRAIWLGTQMVLWLPAALLWAAEVVTP